MPLWHETWRWPEATGSIEPDERPFWDVTRLLRQALARFSGAADANPCYLWLCLAAQGSQECKELDYRLAVLGPKRLGARRNLRVKAVCGHEGGELMHIVRVGNADFRLSCFPTIFVFAIHPLPAPLGHAAGGQAGAALAYGPEARAGEDGIPADVPGNAGWDLRASLATPSRPPDDPLAGLEEEDMVVNPPPACSLGFHALALGFPEGDAVAWWAHLGEGHSCWSAPYAAHTVKISIFGEVVRTLSITNRFFLDFTALI